MNIIKNEIIGTIKPDLKIRITIQGDDSCCYGKLLEVKDDKTHSAFIGNRHALSVEISKYPKYGQKYKDAKWEINWASYGSMELELAENFAIILDEAIKLVKRLNAIK